MMYRYLWSTPDNRAQGWRGGIEASDEEKALVAAKADHAAADPYPDSEVVFVETYRSKPPVQPTGGA